MSKKSTSDRTTRQSRRCSPAYEVSHNMSRFVLEIGTEEIPPRFFPPALRQLREEGAKMLARARLSCREVKVYATPRRLALIVEEMAERQAPATREERGPAARVAFDEEGKPTKAAEGFARRHGMAPEALVVKETEQGEYVFAVIEEPELPATEALAGRLPALIAGLAFPKMMRWGTGKVRFGRPIRWLLALVGAEMVEFELEGLKSGRLTRGHPMLDDGMHSVAVAEEYEATLGAHKVLVTPDERRLAVEKSVLSAAEKEGARVVDGDLLDDTTFLVEYPTTACGQFDSDFLRLPRPVLIGEMQHVQNYFPLEDEKGELLAKFVAVRDGGEEHLDAVLKGWESVLRAKLIDADYFYHEDLKRPLHERVEDLKGVVFQEKLGTVYEKVARVRAVAAAAAEQFGLGKAEREALDRAALLCKADLTTQMVTELSNLQGVIGADYAAASGEPAEVAQAVGEHYRPRFARDEIAETSLGRLLALADKADTISALFAAGIQPTGSADPFGLRREAAGVVSIALAMPRDFSIGGLVKAALQALGEQIEPDRSPEETFADVMAFMRQRLETYLREEQGIRYDLVEAALAVGTDEIGEAERRAFALQTLSAREDFLQIVVACTRPINIAKDFAGGEVEASRFEEDAERELWAAYQEVLAASEGQPLAKLFDVIAEKLREPIDRYFDEVLVMAEDETLRRNRLAMCWQLSQLFRRIADFSLVVQA
jgi:glycyl-tRNA synthetase beta chain